MKAKIIIALALLSIVYLGCQVNQKPSTRVRGTQTLEEREEIFLPKARRYDGMTLKEALAKRKSVREFASEGLTKSEISQILWAANGLAQTDQITGATRTAPSAGALQPLEIYLITKDALFHYQPAEQKLSRLKKGDLRYELSQAALEQTAVKDAPVDIVITAVYERTAVKYRERAERYVLLEAGHAAQNILLQAAALELGGVTIGAFKDEQVQKVLSLPQNHKPLYVMPVGHPKE
jgi:SagB-type dehydrogenase family enzyme